MKQIAAFFSILLLFAIAFSASAQMSKAEEKEWKKRIKALEPEQYKTLIEENKSLKSQVGSLKNELAGVDDKIGEKDDQIAQYQLQVSDLRDQVAKAKAAAAQPQTTTRSVDTGGRVNEEVGVIFKVQIGAFTNKDLSKYLNTTQNFTGETEDGLKKYTLGVFRDYWDADTFKKYLREMGVKDAWIVSFKDGKRVPIKDVLEGVSRS